MNMSTQETICKRCGKVHNQPAIDVDKLTHEAAAELAREIDKQALLQVGAWMDEDKGYSIGTREAYDEFVKKRNYDKLF